MFTYIYDTFLRPKTREQIEKDAARALYQANRRIKHKNKNVQVNGQQSNGPVKLNNLKLEQNKMNKFTLADLLSENSLSKTSNPNYRITNGMDVVFTVPFSNKNGLDYASTRLKAIKYTKQNKGEFANVSVNVKTSNSSTLILTLSSKNLSSVSLPEHFVRKLFGADIPLDKKKVTKKNVIQWSKYHRGKVSKVSKVKDLINVNNRIEQKNALYGLWEKYGDSVAEAVEEIKKVLDPKNIPLVVGSNPEQKDILVLVLQEAMKKYLLLESGVYRKKEKMNVKPLYAKYVSEKRKNLIAISDELPKFCNIPFDWRVHFVHETMNKSNKDQNQHEKHTWDTVSPTLIGSYYRGNVNELKNNKMHTPQSTASNTNFNNSSHWYSYYLRNCRPYLNQSFHTIGSIRYPHVADFPCPLTRTHWVWKYELNPKKSNDASEYEDPWMKKLYNRKGFTAELSEAHQMLESLLSELVRVYKTKVNTEFVKKASLQREVDINMAWELYDICANKCKLNEHPLFRVCAGFGAIHDPNPSKGEFMDRFRYMVHNKPRSKNEAKEQPGLENVKLVLTQSDVKYFFLSFDVYKNKIPNLYNQKIENKESSVNVFNATNSTKNTEGTRKPQQGCRALIHKPLISTLEENSDPMSGCVVVAWPSFSETVEYYTKV